MNEQRKKIARALAVTAEVCGSQLSEGAIAIMVEELATYDFEDVAKALMRIRREHTGRLSLAVIIERMDEAKGLGVDAAWELAVSSRIYSNDETIVVPKAIIQAWPYALWEAGDKQGARMAFKAAYPIRLAECGDEIFVSLGWDVDGRTSAIVEAARSGVITEAKASELLLVISPERKQLAKSQPASIAEIAEITKGLDFDNAGEST